MKSYHFMLSLLLILCLLQKNTTFGAVLFSTLPQTLLLSASPKHGQVLNAGEDSISISWRLNQSLAAGSDELYRNVKLKLCYAPISQVDRVWRKTVDDLTKDKTCQFTIADAPFRRNHSLEWLIHQDVPSALYFVRAYVCNARGDEVAYGQTTDVHKTSNLFEIKAISGRQLSLDIASVCLSLFALVSVFGFFVIEKRNSRRSAKN